MTEMSRRTLVEFPQRRNGTNDKNFTLESEFAKAVKLNYQLTRKQRKERANKRGTDAKNVDKYGSVYCLIFSLNHILQLTALVDPNYTPTPDPESFAHENVINFLKDGDGKDIPSHQMNGAFTVTEYAPSVFRMLRHRQNILEKDYQTSLRNSNRVLHFKTNSKSGAYFFHTTDGRFIIKTVTTTEKKSMLQILAGYLQHVHRNPCTLIAPICGLYRVFAKELEKRETYFIIMESVYARSDLYPIHSVFDLKGSKVGRKAKNDEATYKDQDIIKQEKKLELGALRSKLIQQIQKDTDFLSQFKIMDYSLLVGVHDKKKTFGADGSRILNVNKGDFEFSKQDVKFEHDLERDQWVLDNVDIDFDLNLDGDGDFEELNPKLIRKLSVVRSRCKKRPEDETFEMGDEIYYIGIIDILQTFNTKKQAEGLRKAMHPRKSISAVPPAAYAKRFRRFITSITTGDEIIEAKDSENESLNGSNVFRSQQSLFSLGASSRSHRGSARTTTSSSRNARDLSKNSRSNSVLGGRSNRIATTHLLEDLV